MTAPRVQRGLDGPGPGSDGMFPIQRDREAGIPETRIPWADAELAYRGYSGLYGTKQSLARLAERGGFSPGELFAYTTMAREGVITYEREEELFRQWREGDQR